ncbi:MAG: hypothetical protein ABL998_23400 [Planctomycetota bacterium]
MKGHFKPVLGGVLLLLVGTLWLLLEVGGRRTVESERSGFRTSQADTPLLKEPSPNLDRVVVSLEESADVPIEAAPQETEDGRFDWLRGIVVDSEDAPIAGATLALVRSLSYDNTIYFQRDPGFQARLERVAETRSESDGRFAFKLARGIPFDLVGEAPGRSSGFLPFVQAGEDVLVKLGVEHAVHGHLRREVDGRPAVGATVRRRPLHPGSASPGRGHGVGALRTRPRRGDGTGLRTS